MPDIKHMRTGTTKVRTGCSTCKTRHIKCDEAKPICKRCAISRRPCSYAPPLTQSSHLRMVVYTAPQTWMFTQTPQEREAFDFFLCQTRDRFPLDFTQPILLAAQRGETALVHAIIALGALLRVFEYDDLVPLGSGLVGVRDRFAMQEYGRALRSVRERVEYISPDVVLSCCVLFATFECLRGGRRAAVMHIQSGLNVLREYGLVQWEVVSKSTLRGLFASLDNQAVAIMETSPYDCVMATAGKEAAFTSVIVDELTPLPRGYDMLVIILNHILHRRVNLARALLNGMRPDMIPPLPLSQQEYLEKLDEWYAQFVEGLPENQDLSSYGHDPDILRMWYICARALLIVSPDDPPEAWNRFDADFETVILSVERHLARCSGQSPQRKRSFTFSLGIVQPLCLTGNQCRDPRIRQKAFDLLSLHDRREGFWDSRIAAEAMIPIPGSEGPRKCPLGMCPGTMNLLRHLNNYDNSVEHFK